jgi:Restriction endonuclease S subunits
MLRQQAAGGVQPNLNLRIIKNISVPLPSLEEQKEIVKRVEAAFAQIETMENEAKKALALAERLEQATLAKAFQGQL